MMRIGILSLLLLAVAVPALAANSVYKWTDKSGRVHYGDAPSSVTAEKLPDAPPSASAVPSDAAASSASASADKGKGETDCKTLQSQLDVYRTASRVVERDSLGHEHEYTPEEKQKLIDLAQAKLKTCGTTPPAASPAQ